MSEMVYGWLLRLYPRRFRAEYEEEMRQLFHDRLYAESGFFARLRCWADVLADVVVSVPREYWRPPAPAPATTGYRLSEQAVSQMVWRGHAGAVPVTLMIVMLGLVVGWMGDATRWLLCSVFGTMAFLSSMPLLLLRRSRKRWRGFELKLEEDRVEQLDHGTVVRFLRKSEIRCLLESRFQGLAIYAHESRNSIWVPAQVNGYDELLARLSEWAPVIQPPERVGSVHRSNFLIFAVYPAALLVESPYYAVALALVAGTLMLASWRRRIPSARKPPLAIRLIPAAMVVSLFLKLVFVFL